MYHIAVVEDDKNDRNVLKTYVERYGQENGHNFKITEFENAITFLTRYNPVYDIVFIDILMPHMDGMEAAGKLREVDSSVPLVFITNMSNYAVKGYSVNAVDFVVKPVSYFNFSAMLSKVLRLVENSAGAIILKTSEGKIKVNIDRVSYIDVLDHQVCYHTDGGDFTVWESLKEAEAKLPQDRFAKCNNYCIVNLKYVDGINDGYVKVKDNEIHVSRSKKKEFTDRLLAYYGKYL
jgi:DNA-binding LytR/AlgR family response regulator